MKRLTLLMIILLGVHQAFGQSYIVTYLKGNVYHDHKPIRLHDRLDGMNELTSDDRNSELALFNAQKGKFRLSFQNSKPVVVNNSAKTSEFFQLVVVNYLKSYTTEKTLTTRGDFDLKAFFSDKFGKDARGVCLLEGESLPARSELEPVEQDDQFLLSVVHGKDTTVIPVRRTGSYLVFDEQLAKPFATRAADPKVLSCTLKRRYAENGRYQVEDYAGPIQVTYCSKTYLSALIKTYMEGLDSYYKGDKGKMRADIADQLTFFYGRSFAPAVMQLLKNYD